MTDTRRPAQPQSLLARSLLCLLLLCGLVLSPAGHRPPHQTDPVAALMSEVAELHPQSPRGSALKRILPHAARDTVDLPPPDAPHLAPPARWSRATAPLQRRLAHPSPLRAPQAQAPPAAARRA